MNFHTMKIFHLIVYWIRAIVGKHFFPDANHRTAILTLRRILKANNIDPWRMKEEEITSVVENLRKFAGIYL